MFPRKFLQKPPSTAASPGPGLHELRRPRNRTPMPGQDGRWPGGLSSWLLGQRRLGACVHIYIHVYMCVCVYVQERGSGIKNYQCHPEVYLKYLALWPFSEYVRPYQWQLFRPVPYLSCALQRTVVDSPSKHTQAILEGFGNPGRGGCKSGARTDFHERLQKSTQSQES